MGSRVSAPTARHGTTPMTLDIPHRSFVATAARVVDGDTIRWGERGEDKNCRGSAKALMVHINPVSSLRQGAISPHEPAASWDDSRWSGGAGALPLFQLVPERGATPTQLRYGAAGA
jgi:hypothetical protein